MKLDSQQTIPFFRGYQLVRTTDKWLVVDRDDRAYYVTPRRGLVKVIDGVELSRDKHRTTLPIPTTIIEEDLPVSRSVPISSSRVLNFSPGLQLIVGAAVSGKTTLLSTFVDPETEFVPWSEPRSDALDNTLEAALGVARVLSISDFVAIDSVSVPLYRGSDKMEKGLSASNMLLLSRIDGACRRLGVTMVMTFAPMVLGEKDLFMIGEKMINPRTSGTVLLTDPGVGSVSIRRQGERIWEEFTWSKPAHVGAKAKVASSREEESDAESFDSNPDSNPMSADSQPFIHVRSMARGMHHRANEAANSVVRDRITSSFSDDNAVDDKK
jgi:hypothetical protein